jgi:hypothetical protein
MTQTPQPATAAEIIEIVGPLDDAALMRIVETEATLAEVLGASTWATADDQIGTELEHRPRSRRPGLRHPQARGTGARRALLKTGKQPDPDQGRGANRGKWAGLG